MKEKIENLIEKNEKLTNISNNNIDNLTSIQKKEENNSDSLKINQFNNNQLSITNQEIKNDSINKDDNDTWITATRKRRNSIKNTKKSSNQNFNNNKTTKDKNKKIENAEETIIKKNNLYPLEQRGLQKQELTKQKDYFDNNFEEFSNENIKKLIIVLPMKYKNELNNLSIIFYFFEI